MKDRNTTILVVATCQVVNGGKIDINEIGKRQKDNDDTKNLMLFHERQTAISKRY